MSKQCRNNVHGSGFNHVAQQNMLKQYKKSIKFLNKIYFENAGIFLDWNPKKNNQSIDILP